MEKQVEISQEVKDFYRSIGMPVPNPLHSVDVGSHIVQHKTHSFDDHGNVIVVDGEKEDLWQSIPQYADEVGPKNIIRLIEAGADAEKLLTANAKNAFYGDVTNFEAASVNELGEKIPAFNVAAKKALEEFNKEFGTNLDMKSFIDLYDKGLLSAHIEGVKAEKGDNNDGKE